MAQRSAMVQRVGKEMALLERDPPPGVCCYPKGDKINELEAVIEGAADTPYAGGQFKLDITVPDGCVHCVACAELLVTHLNPPSFVFRQRFTTPTLTQKAESAWTYSKKGKK